MPRRLLDTIRNHILSLPAGEQPDCPPAAVQAQLRALLPAGTQGFDPDTPLHHVRYVVVDTETTGFAPYRDDKVIALGAVVVADGRPRPGEAFHRLVNPGRPIPPQITALTGISDGMVAGADDLFEALLDFLPLLDGACLVGHNVGFDLGFLNLELRRCCGAVIENPALDTQVIARALYPSLGSHSLDSLLAVHGIEPVGRHTAAGDAWLTARLFSLQLELLDLMRIQTVGDLYAFLTAGKQITSSNNI